MNLEIKTTRDILDLFKMDVHELGIIADGMNGRYVSFTLNVHVNYSNVCESRCKICAFHRADGYTMSPQEVVEKVVKACAEGVREVHIVGSHNPEIGIEYFEEILRGIRSRVSQNVAIKALTAAEVVYYSKKEGMSCKEFLSRLKDAGLSMLAGGGAEILVDEVRKEICPNKCSRDEWLRVMEIAHGMEIKSNATMLFGHIESYRDRAEHLYKLRKLQERTGGFVAFIPLLFHPHGTEIGVEREIEKASPGDVLKTIAVSRIALDNFKGIKAYWVMLGLKLSQIALNYGANDLDGTVKGERIAHAAGARTPYELEKERILSIIRGAGKIAVERDAFFNAIAVYG